MGEPQQTSRGPALFAQCRICIIISNELDNGEAEELATDIQRYGGNAQLHRVPAPLPAFHEYTHFVSSTVEFAEYDAICDALIPVARPDWVDTCIAQLRIVNPRQYSPDPRRFLSDVNLTCADIPEGDKDAIVGAVLAMGGLFTSKLTATTTHLVALSMESPKCQAVKNINEKLAAKGKPQISIVLPHWFDDCLKLGKRIDEGPYLLPDPEILRARADEPVKPRKSKDIAGASNPTPTSIPPALTAKPRQDIEVFNGRTLMLAEDIGMSDHLIQSIADLVSRGGGKMTRNVHETDIYICRYREGRDYQVASRLGKEVGNLAWLFHIITRNDWTSPLRRLLHYPVAREGIPEFKGLQISLSNYVGEARTYLENLIIAAGAECTKHLKQNNSHLITAHGTSEKCVAAREWGVHIVNHLWLEESYASWKRQPESNPRYTHLPPRTNLGEVVGQTQIDRVAIEEKFLPAPEEEINEKLSEENAPEEPTKDDDGDVTMENVEEGRATAEQAPEAQTPAAPKETSTTRSEKPARKSRKSLETPSASKPQGQENEAPSSTHSRKSKEMATARLHQIAPDIALYEREKKRAGGVIYGGRRRSEASPEDKPRDKNRKRSIEAQAQGERDEEKEKEKEKKKAKPVKSQVEMYLLVTGFKRWVDQPKTEAHDKRVLKNLGVQVVSDPKKCTHVAAPSILRTPKFLNAIAYAPQILSDKFIEQCVEQEKLLDANKFKLFDGANEARYNIAMANVRKRAQKNKNHLMDGMTAYCVENIQGGFDVFKSIVETNGGQCLMYRGRPGAPAATLRREKSESGEDEVFLLSGDSDAQKKVWKKFREQVRHADKVPRIVRVDWLLESVMAQEMRWKEEWEFKDESAN